MLSNGGREKGWVQDSNSGLALPLRQVADERCLPAILCCDRMLLRKARKNRMLKAHKILMLSSESGKKRRDRLPSDRLRIGIVTLRVWGCLLACYLYTAKIAVSQNSFVLVRLPV
mmetsp:Transcript_24670/g.68111  ORF Transcript_24670/g.68111 Transcript_24670/m.68111 type:complete len:115 (-) Transcript_24670:55-399(-)